MGHPGDWYDDIDYIADQIGGNPYAKDNPDWEHHERMKQTGFWGAQGAGCIFMAKSTGRFLLAHRSPTVKSPNTWGTWGGAIDKGANPKAAIEKEAEEEVGYDIHGDDISPLPFTFVATNDASEEVFRYFNFLVVVDEEFIPVLNWENQGSAWVRYGEWPSPMHPGLADLLGDSATQRFLQRMASDPQP